MITLLFLSRIAERIENPSDAWYLVAAELLFDAFAVVVLFGIVFF